MFFLVQFEMVLVLDVANDFPLIPGHVGLYVIILWIVLKSSVLACPSNSAPVVEGRHHLIAAGEDGSLVFPRSLYWHLR